MRAILSFLRDPEYRLLLLSTFAMLSLGTLFYHLVEGWSVIDAAYFSFISLTTVGYGDVTPSTDVGKVFTIMYLTVGIGLILSFIDILFKHYSKPYRVDESRADQ